MGALHSAYRTVLFLLGADVEREQHSGERASEAQASGGAGLCTAYGDFSSFARR